jgi:hypothetical protein
MRPAALCLTFVLALACVACGAPPSPGTPKPEAPPSEAAVLVHTDEGVQLSIADFETGRLMPIGPAGGATRQPVWSPDGASLAYRVADQLFVHAVGTSAVDLAVINEVNVDAMHSYVFSPDGKQLAVALRSSVIVVAADGRGRRVLATFPDQRVADLVWADGEDEIFALVTAPSPSNKTSVVRLRSTGEEGATQAIDGISRFLGWRSQGRVLLALQSSGGDGVVQLGRSGDPTQLAGSVPADLHVVDYLAATDELVLAQDGEDAGPVALYRGPALGGAPPQRWLAAYPALDGLQLSADGAWALFIDRVTEPPGTPTGAPAGSVVRVPLTARYGGLAAQVVLEATPTRAFSDAVPRPAEAQAL